MSYNSATGLVNRKVLESYVASLLQSEERFIARKMPLIETSSIRAGFLSVEDIDDDGPEDLIRAQGEPFYPMGSGVVVDTVAFSCLDRGATESVDERDRKDAAGNTGGLLKLEQSAYKRAALRLMANEERRLGAVLGTTGNWATNLVGNVDFAYFDGNNSDPLKAILQAQDLGGRFRANTVIFGSRAVYEATVASDKLVEGLSTMGFRGLVSKAELDQYFAIKLGVQKIFIMEATGKNTRNPASAVRVDLGGDWIWVGYLPDEMDVAGGRGQFKVDATGVARVVADHEELVYDRLGQIHKYSIGNAVDFVPVAGELGTIMTTILTP